MSNHVFYYGTGDELLGSIGKVKDSPKDILPVNPRGSQKAYWLIIYPDCGDKPGQIGVAYLRKTWRGAIRHADQKAKEETGEVWERSGITVMSHHAHNMKCRIKMNLCAVIEVEPVGNPVLAVEPRKLPNQNRICDEERARIGYESSLNPCGILERGRRDIKQEALQEHINRDAGQSMKRIRGAEIGE